MTWEVLCKCSGKYIDIYFNLKITFPIYSSFGGVKFTSLDILLIFFFFLSTV